MKPTKITRWGVGWVPPWIRPVRTSRQSGWPISPELSLSSSSSIPAEMCWDLQVSRNSRCNGEFQTVFQKINYKGGFQDIQWNLYLIQSKSNQIKSNLICCVSICITNGMIFGCVQNTIFLTFVEKMRWFFQTNPGMSGSLEALFQPLGFPHS